jgi:EAL domain-containing protein (putative c-di-GMP-specific phosphodiesterase class I)
MDREGVQVTQTKGRHLELCKGLVAALEREELLLHYQPVLDLRSGDVAAVEALIRWQHPEHGLLPPLEFIPTAERTGQIIEVGEWALQQACQQAGVWREAGLPVRMAVNLSARQFSAPDLVGCVARTLRDTGVPPEMLELELTETMFADPVTSTAILLRMRQLGVRVAIDDFGTGYSSLSYLLRFPLNTLKIDRSFIERASHDQHASSVVGFMIAMAHELDLHVVAEGVESEMQERLLVTHGCDLSQGFLHTPPLTAHDCERWMRQRITRPLTSIPGGAEADLPLGTRPLGRRRRVRSHQRPVAGVGA